MKILRDKWCLLSYSLQFLTGEREGWSLIIMQGAMKKGRGVQDSRPPLMQGGGWLGYAKKHNFFRLFL